MSGKDPLPRELAYDGVRAQNPPEIIPSVRAPTANDKNYPIGTMWMNTVTHVSYQLVAAPGIWTILGSAMGGDVSSLTGDDAVAVMSTAGNINVIGDTTQGIDITGDAGTSTLTVAGINATTTQIGVSALASLAESQAGSVTNKSVTPAGLTARLAQPGSIGSATPGQGNFTNITAAPTTNPAIVVTSAAATAGITVSADVGQDALLITSGDLHMQGFGDISVSGGIATGTALTLNSGAIGLLEGSLTIESSTYGIKIKAGAATDTLGSATLGGLGVSTVLNTNIAATDKIFLSRLSSAGTPGYLTYTISAGVSFTVTSSTAALDNGSVINYLIVGQPA